MKLALRLSELEGLAEVGIENLFAEPVRGDGVETMDTLAARDKARQRIPERP